MDSRRYVLSLASAALVLALVVFAKAEAPLPPAVTPPAPVAAPPAPGVPPAQPGAGPASPAKGPPVILSALPPMSGVFGGKVEFAEKAFPIVVESKEVAVQSAIRAVKPLVCATCKGTGKVGKRVLITPAAGVVGSPVLQTWEEDCRGCGGFKDVLDPRIGQRMLEVIDRLSHAARDDKFDELRKAAEGCLARASEVRDKSITTFICKPIIKTETHTEPSASGEYHTRTVRTLTGATRQPDQQKSFHMEVAPLVEPLWARVGPQAPVGQAVLVIGTMSEKAEAGGWVWMRIKPSGKGPEAIILCGTAQANVAVEGKIVLGGLMVGRWIPDGSAAAAPTSAAGAKGPPPPMAGPLQQGTLPVLLAVVTAEGK
ncbi:MAG: hypothetical protein NTY65_06145 [Planctomycetota bacterium]|nr:hypothetical protein [Planctomycetota bacterium]